MVDGRCQLHGTGTRPPECVSAERQLSVRFFPFSETTPEGSGRRIAASSSRGRSRGQMTVRRRSLQTTTDQNSQTQASPKTCLCPLDGVFPGTFWGHPAARPQCVRGTFNKSTTETRPLRKPEKPKKTRRSGRVNLLMRLASGRDKSDTG